MFVLDMIQRKTNRQTFPKSNDSASTVLNPERTCRHLNLPLTPLRSHTGPALASRFSTAESWLVFSPVLKLYFVYIRHMPHVLTEGWKFGEVRT